jgi:hypothetical protein
MEILEKIPINYWRKKMTATKFLLLSSGILIGLVVLMVSGLLLSFLVLEELSEDGKIILEIPSLLPLTFPLRWSGEDSGNEFTGQTSAWLFGLSCLPLVFSITSKFILQKVSLPLRLKGFMEWFYRLNKKYFLPFHTYLSLPALALSILHLSLSTCPNPLPELGLILVAVLATTGLIIKFRIGTKISPKFLKSMYQFHTSLVVLGILASVLVAGHLLMD